MQVNVIATGGLASIVIPASHTVTHRDSNLTPHGLRLAWDRNQPA